MCARVLGSLELEEVSEIIESDTFSLVSLIEGTISLDAKMESAVHVLTLLLILIIPFATFRLVSYQLCVDLKCAFLLVV